MQQTSNQMPATGPMVGHYYYGKAARIFVIILAATLLSLAGAILYFSTLLPANSAGPVEFTTPSGSIMRFNGQVSMLYFTSALLAVLALGVSALYAWHSRYRHSSYELYEKGVAYTTKGVRTYVPFTEIEDLYLFSSGQTVMTGMVTNLAFRRNANEPFHRVIEPLKRFHEFQQLFRELYLAARQPAVLEALQAGEGVTFKYIATGEVWRKRLSGNFLDAKTLPIVVCKDHLQVQGSQVSIAALRSLDTSAWSEKVTLKDASGNTVLSTVATGIMNMDLFLNTLSLLIEDVGAQAPQAVASQT
ncbi:MULTISPECIES: hypothetical protein [Pseudomonas putida group]|uniref:hypothetical protein n=1 Tax=Pseudomonas putida group TaxID=136845 RepID=UPI0018AAC018|nr:hypothetical protein [Pseudomonas monteilii]MBF8745439.1 hypothetical protein [Pseudomonas monteilii]